MSLLIGYLLPALLVSVCALIALHVARSAPPVIRLSLASVGLVAWLVPWSLIGFQPMRLPLAAIKQDIAVAAERVVPALFAPDWSWLVVFLPGLVWFALDLIAHQATIDRWRRASRCGEALRRYLPAGIADQPAEIRIIADSPVAAATGWGRPTIWIGDRVIKAGEQQLALAHEANHLRRGDPLRLMLIGLIARSFWFNPLVAALKRQAILAIESGCDEACARLLGRKHYRKTLARLVLVGQASSGPALAPALRSAKLDLMRLELLAGNPRMDGRAWAAVMFVFAAGVYGAALGAAAPDQMSSASSVVFSEPSHYGYDVPPTWSLD
jgi:hypothetical protein